MSWKLKMVIYQHRQPVLSNQKQKIHTIIFWTATQELKLQFKSINQTKPNQAKEKTNSPYTPLATPS